MRRTDRTAGIPIFGQPIHNREILEDIQPDSFRLERQVSSDGGNTWRSEIRFSYRRMAEGDPLSER